MDSVFNSKGDYAAALVHYKKVWGIKLSAVGKSVSSNVTRQPPCAGRGRLTFRVRARVKG